MGGCQGALNQEVGQGACDRSRSGIFFPRTYMENFSQAHVVTSASFSICAYHCSVSDIEREAYATGFQSESVFWSRTAPRPYADASAEISDSFSGSYRVRTVGWESSSFTWAKACSWLGPQMHVFPLLSSSCSGSVSVARFGENFPSWLTIPINLRSSGTFSGGFIRRMAEVLSGSARMPLPSMMCPRNFSSVRENSHFSGLRVAPADSIHLRTALIRLSCSSWSLPKTRTSSIWHTKPSRPL